MAAIVACAVYLTRYNGRPGIQTEPASLRLVQQPGWPFAVRCAAVFDNRQARQRLNSSRAAGRVMGSGL